MNMQNKVMGFVAALAISVFLCGCREDGPSDAEVAFAVIDGEPLTVSFVSNTVMVSARISELASHPISPGMFARWGNGRAAELVPRLIQAQLFDRALQRMGIAPTKASDAAVLGKYNKMTRRKAGSVDELAALFGGLEGHFRQQFARESRFRAYYNSRGVSKHSEEEIALRFKSATNEIRRLRRIDAMAKADARAAWDRLKAGESWETVATNCTEDALLDDHFADYWKKWDEFRIDEVEPEALKAALKTMKAGDFTQPIELEEGLAIVRVNARDGDNLTCSRILFRMAVQKTYPSRDEVIKELTQEKAKAAQREVLKKARAAAKIEYPLGKRFAYAIWPEKHASRAAKNDILMKKSHKKRNGKGSPQ